MGWRGVDIRRSIRERQGRFVTRPTNWEIELPVDPFCIWIIYQIRMTQFQIDRGISGPGRIRERSKSAYLALSPNSLTE
jgi:hypothetical protein